MFSLADNLATVQRDMQKACARSGREPSQVTLIAVSKTTTLEQALELRELGIEDFGENRLPQGLHKAEGLAPARVHFIGHLQTNKVPQVVGHFACIHSLDRPSLLEALVRRAETLEVVQPCFVQVNVSGEASKGGVSPADLSPLLRAATKYERIPVRGLMTMAPLTHDETVLRKMFSGLKTLAREYGLAGLSMGMSNDFSVAIEEGATHIRVGQRLFGSSHVL